MFDDKQIVLDDVTILSSCRSPILKNISFSVSKGEFIFITGRTGSGKSTLLRSMYADLVPTEGNIEILDYKIQEIKKSEIPMLRRKLGIVFQNYRLLDSLTIKENLELALLATGWNCKDSMEERMDEILSKLKISWVVDKYPKQLSGGEQQRVSLARAILNNPLILLADEPTGSLDYEVEDEIMNYLLELNSSGVTIILATHSQVLLSQYTFRRLKITNGFCSEEVI